MIKEIHRFRQKEKSNVVLAGLFKWFTLMFLVLLTLSFLESMFWFASSIRIGMVLFAGVLFSILFILWICTPIYSYLFQKKHPSDVNIALKIGEYFPTIKDRLADAIQVMDVSDDQNVHTSSSLARSAFDQITDDLDNVRVFDALSNHSIVKKFSGFLITGLLLVLFLIIIPSGNEGFFRIVHPFTLFEKPSQFVWSVTPGNISLIEGDSLQVHIHFKEKIPDEVKLILINEDETSESLYLDFPFTYQFTRIQKDLTYQFLFSREESKSYQVNVEKRPFVRKFNWMITPPAYTRLPVQFGDDNQGNLTVLKGSYLNLNLLASKALSNGLIQSEDKKLRFAIQDQKATAEYQFLSDLSYTFLLTDTSGIHNLNPIQYQLQMREDRYPVISIQSPSQHVDLTDPLLLPLVTEANDDFGIHEMAIKFWINTPSVNMVADTQQIQLNIPDGFHKNIILDHLWDLNGLNLFPEDVVSYQIVAVDNDVISGPKMSRSLIHTARFPSIFEIFQEVENDQISHTDFLEQKYEESEALLREIEDISEAIKAGKELTWEDTQEFQDTLEKQKGIEEEIQTMQQDLEEIVDRLSENDLVSLDVMKKYGEIQQLYDEIASDELMNAMQQFQDLVQQMDPKEMQEAMENMEFSQEQMLQSMDRTIQMLKKLQAEQKLDALIQQVENLSEQQQDVNESLNSETMNEQTQKQEERIAEDYEKMRENLSQLNEMMEDIPGMPSDQMKNLTDSLDDQGLQEQLQSMQNSLQQNETETARQSGEEIQQSFAGLQSGLEQLQQSMEQKSKQKIQKSMERASERLLQASQKQEMLADQTNQNWSERQENARNQQSLKKYTETVMDSLMQLSKETMAISPDLMRSMGQAGQKMEDVIRELSENHRSQAMRGQQEAMGALNNALLSMQDAMDQMNQGGGSSGMEQLMQGMENLTQQQMALNRQLMDMLQQGQLTLSQQAALKRMAAQQQAIRQSLQNMQGQSNSEQQYMGRLDKLIDDMADTIEELREGKADSRTIERQEKILSRMLDAQRSIRERDYSRERQGRSGEDVNRASPIAREPSVSDILKRIERDLLTLPDEGYTEDYQQLIRDYFEALSKTPVVQ